MSAWCRTHGKKIVTDDDILDHSDEKCIIETMAGGVEITGIDYEGSGPVVSDMVFRDQVFDPTWKPPTPTEGTG